MIELLKAQLGFRDSLRLFAAADILSVFGQLGEFSRSEVLREFSDVYTTKCLDRALADLESGFALAVIQPVKADVSAGASYKVTPFNEWRTRQQATLDARKNRHGRGGCRKVA